MLFDMVLTKRLKECRDPFLSDWIHTMNRKVRNTMTERGTILDQPLSTVEASLLGELTAKLVLVVLVGQIMIEADEVRNASILDGPDKVLVVAHDGPRA